MVDSRALRESLQAIIHTILFLRDDMCIDPSTGDCKSLQLSYSRIPHAEVDPAIGTGVEDVFRHLVHRKDNVKEGWLKINFFRKTLNPSLFGLLSSTQRVLFEVWQVRVVTVKDLARLKEEEDRQEKEREEEEEEARKRGRRHSSGSGSRQQQGGGRRSHSRERRHSSSSSSDSTIDREAENRHLSLSLSASNLRTVLNEIYDTAMANIEHIEAAPSTPSVRSSLDIPRTSLTVSIEGREPEFGVRGGGMEGTRSSSFHRIT